jgi:hypothetical protein
MTSPSFVIYDALAMDPSVSNPLCLECGLCCNGVIFADVQLEREDDAERLRSLGLQIVGFRRRRGKEGQTTDPQSAIRNPRFPQPCAAFDGCRCRIYADRPKYCRQFECLLLKNLHAGRIERTAALRLIRTARRRADIVRRLLRELGDADEQAALSGRFRRMKQRMESGIPDGKTAGVFSGLTLAFQDLNVLLSEAFYSGPGQNSPNI